MIYLIYSQVISKFGDIIIWGIYTIAQGVPQNSKCTLGYLLIEKMHTDQFSYEVNNNLK